MRKRKYRPRLMIIGALLLALTWCMLCTPAVGAIEKPSAAQEFDLDKDEIDLLARLIMAEAGSPREPQEGRVAVANVVLNRLRDGRWGNSIRSVIYSKHQFAKPKKFATQECYAAVYAALSGEKAVNDNIMFFRSASTWRRGRCVAEIGTHHFYVLY